MAKDISGRNVPTGGGQGEVKPSYYKSLNKYPKLKHKHYMTARYADIFPFFYFHGTRGDKVPLNSSHELDTFTLKSPLKSDFRLNKTYVKVPYKAIYPHNWDIMRVTPTSGDDVPEDVRAILNVGKYTDYVLQDYIGKLANLSRTLSQVEYSNLLTSFLKDSITLESLLSEGSLFPQFNMHISKYLFDYYLGEEVLQYNLANWDQIFDQVYSKFNDISLDYLFTLQLGDQLDPSSLISYNVVGDTSITTYPNAISFRTALDLMRDEDFNIIVSEDLFDYRDSFNFPFVNSIKNVGALDIYLNIEPIIAYQLSCHQFFTDDKVDFIYDAEQYRRSVLSLYRRHYASAIIPAYFDWNDYQYEYDVFSKKYFDFILNNPTGDILHNFAKMLLCHRRSLRYKDYFTGSRPQPLANGDFYSAEVNNNAVSAVDIAQSMQRVRFYHNVSLAGRRLADYLSMIVPGKRIEASDEQPQWLAHESFVLKGFEVENTGNAQLSDSPNDRNIITTNLKSNESRFSFMTQVDDQCIILGLGSFDIARIYCRTIDRFAFHFDRYDDFIPQLQFIGDQEVYDKELGLNIDAVVPIPFGYQVRHKEYKEKYNYASGGFIDNLPSWAMITDNRDGVPAPNNISPLYIRAVPSEIDRFYKSLTGYSLASYFHFILVMTNDLSNCERAMIPAPEILK